MLGLNITRDAEHTGGEKRPLSALTEVRGGSTVRNAPTAKAIQGAGDEAHADATPPASDFEGLLRAALAA